jgi:hypothetical protein
LAEDAGRSQIDLLFVHLLRMADRVLDDIESGARARLAGNQLREPA